MGWELRLGKGTGIGGPGHLELFIIVFLLPSLMLVEVCRTWEVRGLSLLEHLLLALAVMHGLRDEVG